MGWDLGRVVGAVATGGLSEAARAATHRPGPSGSQDVSGMQFDPNTFMPGGNVAPTADQAINADFVSQRLYQEAKNRYFSDALGSNAQALKMLGQYRPGGGAAVAANVEQNRGAMQLNIANSLERPDLFANKRQADADAAAKAAKQAGQMALLGNVIQAGATVAGAALAGPAGAAGGAALGGALGAGLATPGGSSAIPVTPGSQPAQGGRGGAAPQPLQTPGAGSAAGGGAQARLGGGGGAAGAGGAPAGAQQVAQASPLQSAQLAMAASTADWDALARLNANNDYFVSRMQSVRRPPALYDRIPASGGRMR